MEVWVRLFQQGKEGVRDHQQVEFRSVPTTDRWQLIAWTERYNDRNPSEKVVISLDRETWLALADLIQRLGR